ncbi:hypothetical protein LCGC14_0434670 [marine sediment metagenome]|uniref:DUF5131 family protein n=1 Tax=marine sediment metagenome TaxID=412755 RepID=A0A0F9SLY0_9ZZZZ
MSLKTSKGNMYDWVTHMHSHLGGECPHKCSYCYVQRNRFGVNLRYQGPHRFLSHELKVDYGYGKTIFIEHMNDMFAQGIPGIVIQRILEHCTLYPGNKYIFQTKNPIRAYRHTHEFPKNYMLGTTIESNRYYSGLSQAPDPVQRYEAMLKFPDVDKFITIEPILDFDVDELVKWIVNIKPSFVNIGADSKNCKLPEPSSAKVWALITALQYRKITIKKKVNLGRMLN